MTVSADRPVRIGVVAVHGVAPLPRYSFEDQFSTTLQSALAGAGQAWKLDTTFPPVTGHIGDDPEAIRLTSDTLTWNDRQIDVHEVYWSPIDKNRTTPASVAGWLLGAAFVPLNNNAKFPGAPWKATFDLGYAIVAMLVAAIAALGGLVLAWNAYSQIVALALTVARAAAQTEAAPPAFFDAVANPLLFLTFLQPREAISVLAAVVGVVCLGQAISAILGLLMRLRRPRHLPDTKRAPRTLWRIAFVLAVGAALATFAANFPIGDGRTLGDTVLVLVAAVLALQGGSSIARNFLVNRLGDVQIYTSGDDNSSYFGYRQQIRTLAEQILLSVLMRKTDDDTPYYDKIVVVGYSLGATISMDALLRVHEIHEASRATISDADWGRIRAFVTFGCALEKTKYFFAARDVSPSARREEWNSRLDGHLFTHRRDVLGSDNDPGGLCGIFWLNLWYFTDIIANQMLTFVSTEQPRVWGAKTDLHSVCLNQRLYRSLLTDPFPHGSYLSDPNFWHPSTPSDDGTPCGAMEVFQRLL